MIDIYTGTVSWQSDEVKEAVSYEVEMSSFVDPEMSSLPYGEAIISFANGEGGFLAMGTWITAQLVNELGLTELEDFDVIPMLPPVSQDVPQKVAVTANSLSIVKGTDNLELAKAYLSYFARADVQGEWANTTGCSASVEEGVDYDSVLSNKMAAEFKDLEKDERRFDPHSSVSMDYWNLITSLLLGNTDADSFVVSMDDIIAKSVDAFNQ
jgi:ABC-type glycerol-3-phosphate transport system substrate-binding protein